MRLLFAEDEKSLSRAVTAILKKNNYSVDAVYNGADALDYLATENYDGVILDVMMPKVDGFTVLKRMREAGNKTPVLMLTARSEIDDKVYHALVPLGDDGKAVGDEYIILREVEDENGDMMLESIEDDEEFDRVADLFDDEFAEIDYDEGASDAE